MLYSSSIRIPFQRDRIFHFFNDIERLLRLNPQWAVLSVEGDLTPVKGLQFTVNIRYDRSEKEIKYAARIEEFIKGELLTIQLYADVMSRVFSMTVRDEGASSLVEYTEASDREPSVEEKREINLWLRSIANYIIIQEKKTLFSKAWKWFLDKIWLNMSPTGRRIVLIIIFTELLAFVFFIMLLIYLLIFKGF